jgi:ankyrin repeat protein
MITAQEAYRISEQSKIRTTRVDKYSDLDIFDLIELNCKKGLYTFNIYLGDRQVETLKQNGYKITDITVESPISLGAIYVYSEVSWLKI